MFSSFIRSSGPIRFFARRELERQILACELNYAADGETTLVIPIPVAQKDRDRSVKFINLSLYKDFFEDLERLFPRDQSKRKTKPVPIVNYAKQTDAVYLSTMAEFENLPEKFRISQEFWSKLSQYHDHGFVVVFLPDTVDSMTGLFPFGFEFKSRLSDRLFFPTVHLRDCHLSPHATFNHELYYQGEKRLIHDCPSQHNLEEMMDLNRAPDVLNSGKVYRRTLSGRYPNSDVTI